MGRFLTPSVGAVLGVAVMAKCTHRLRDFDVWFHLATGRWIAEHGTVPTQDVFSIAARGEPWLAHSWLTDWLLYQAWMLGGAELICALGGALAALVFVVALEPVAGRGLVVAAASGVLLMWPLSVASPVRPYMFSLLLFAVTWRTVRTWLDDETRRIWWLVPLSALWANLHGGFVLGVALVAYVAVAEAISARFALRDTRALGPPQVKTLALVAVAMFAVGVVNPRHYELLLYPFQYLGQTGYKAYLLEWQSPDLDRHPEIVWFIGAWVGVLLASRKPKEPVETLLGFVMLVAACDSVRNVPLFGIIVVPQLGLHLEDIVDRLKLPAGLKKSRGSVVPGLLVCGAIFALGCLGGPLDVARLRLVQPTGVDARHLPEAEVDFMIGKNITGRMFSLYAWGGYLLWRYYPTPVVAVDGRADIYPPDYLGAARKTQRAIGTNDWSEFLDAQEIDIVIVKTNHTPLEAVLAASPGWRTLARGDLASAWVRSTDPRGPR